jgi:4-amino-4-deoxy-L-arabinose transferase-like glycosyltransferase
MKRRAWIVLLGVVALALRCAFLIDHDEDIDALRFRLAVERFDVAELRPHTPYYPVFVAAAKLVAWLGASPRAALGLVSAAAGAILVVATALLAREVLGRRAAILAGLFALASPFLWLLSERLLSDAAGVAAFTTALWLAVRARRVAAEGGSPSELRTASIVLFGVALGVRLSYFPIAIACAVLIALAEGGGRAWLARARDLGAGVALWLVPLVVIGGPRALVRTTWIQAMGHFTRWGGSVITVPSPLARAHGVAWGLWANALGGAWLDAPAWRWLGAPITIALLFVAVRRVDSARSWVKRHPEIAASVALYFAWALFGQNIAHKPRHWAPLAPLLCVALAAGADDVLSRGRRGALLVTLLLAEQLVDGASLARAHVAPSPAAAIVRFLREGGEAGSLIVTCDLARMIEDGAPGRTVIRIASEADLQRALAAPGGALVTSECLARSPAAPRAHVVFSRPRSRYVGALWPDLALSRVSP